MGDFIGRSDLLGELPFVEHPLPPEEAEDEDVALSDRGFTRRAEEVCILMGCSA